MPRPLPVFRAGAHLTARALNVLVDAVRRQRLTAGENGGIELQEFPDGTMIRCRPTIARYLGVANGNITARSGTTPGAGIVTIWQNVGGTLTSTGLNVDVLSFTAASGGIAGGKYCWIEQDSDGYWWVTSAEC
jgi:hypothetical protein